MTALVEFPADARVLITGGTGLVGRALAEVLQGQGYANVVGVGSRDCDLRDGAAVERLMAEIKPEFVFHLAARVHGIGGNSRYKSDILYENVMINTHVVEQSRRACVKKIVAMGSGCVYPELKGHVELHEDQIWIGPPHASEDSYAHSKRLMLAQLDAAGHQYGLKSAFAISGNLYGPHDNFNIEEGHVTPSLVAKFHEALRTGGTVSVWGSGVAIRDFSYSEDAARALVEIMKRLEGPVNLGSGFQRPIGDIVRILQSLCQGKVTVQWDATKPDGQLVRYYNLDKLKGTGFRAEVDLEEGVKRTFEWYSANAGCARK
jgi:GDP-L-fucose synthase